MECKKDLEGLVNYVVEMEYRDMIQQLMDEPSYLEEGVITEAEFKELENLRWSDNRVEEIVDKCCLNPNNLHVYALACRVWKELLQEK